MATAIARTEALRRNAPARFQLVSSLTSACTLSTSGLNWVVNLTASTSPASSCNSAVSSTTSPYIVQAMPVISSTSGVVVAAGQSTVSFNGLGRQTASTNPTAPVADYVINISSSNGTCIASSGTLRCLRLTVGSGGQIRMCDPSITSATSNNNAAAC